MNRLFLVVLIGVSCVFSSCMKKIEPNPELKPNFTFTSSVSSGVNAVKDKLPMISDTKLDIKLSDPVETDPIWKYQLERIFKIDALSGQTVSDIYFGERYVFVSYRSSGSQYSGTVDVYSVWNAQNIYRKARFSFGDVNINAVYHDSKRLVLACSSKEKPAFVEVISYDPGENDEPKMSALESVDASNLCGIAMTNNRIFVLANEGKTGIYVFDANTFKQSSFVSIQYPLSMISDSESGKIYILQTTATLVELGSTGEIAGTTTLKINNAGQNKGLFARNRIFIRSDNQIQILNSNRSDFQAPFTWQGGGQNNLAVGKNISQMKNWLIILGKNGTSVHFCGLRNRTDANVDVTEIFTIENVGQALSLVASNENVAFIASQNGSIQILQKVTTGFPDIPVYEYDKQIVNELNTTIKTLLPYATNNLEIYANLQVTGVNGATTIKTTAKTKIYTSIISLYGTLTNSIGYYTFNSNALPGAANQLNKTILFPNTIHSMNIGNSVFLCNAEGEPIEFAMGQEIGTFMIQNGWDPKANNGYGGIDINGSTMYSHLRYNRNNYQQQILFKLEENPKFIFIGFKDKWQDDTSYDGNMCNVVIAISDNINGDPIKNIDTGSIKIPEKTP